MAYSSAPLTTRDGVRLHQNIWLPDGDVRSVLVLVHGVVEHSGRYGELADALNAGGCAVYAADLRGHGRSAGDRVWVRRFDQYLDDVECVIAGAGGRHPDRPLFLLGHSMGGTILALLAVTRQPEVRGFILSAAALKVGGGVYPILRRVAAVAGWLFPRLRIAKMTGANLSRDPQVVADFRRDPLVSHGRLPNRTVAEVLRVARWLGPRLEAFRQPLLILHGTGDRVTDPEGSRQLHARAASIDKTIQLYPGLYHDLLHEPERDQVFRDIAGWIAVRQAGAKRVPEVSE